MMRSILISVTTLALALALAAPPATALGGEDAPWTGNVPGLAASGPWECVIGDGYNGIGVCLHDNGDVCVQGSIGHPPFGPHCVPLSAVAPLPECVGGDGIDEPRVCFDGRSVCVTKYIGDVPWWHCVSLESSTAPLDQCVESGVADWRVCREEGQVCVRGTLGHPPAAFCVPVPALNDGECTPPRETHLPRVCSYDNGDTCAEAGSFVLIQRCVNLMDECTETGVGGWYVCREDGQVCVRGTVPRPPLSVCVPPPR